MVAAIDLSCHNDRFEEQKDFDKTLGLNFNRGPCLCEHWTERLPRVEKVASLDVATNVIEGWVALTHHEP